MTMASPGTRIVPDISSKLMGGLNLSITPEDCEDGGHGTCFSDEKAWQPPSAYAPFSSAVNQASNEYARHTIDLINDSSSSSSSYKGKLPVVLEESESFSHREGSSSSTGDLSSSSSSLSIASSSASSTRAIFHRGDKNGHNHKPREPWKRPRKRVEGKKLTIMSVLLWPLKKVRDGYMSCIMGFDGAGDLSGLAQGSTFATAGKFFADEPATKTDAKNYG